MAAAKPTTELRQAIPGQIGTTRFFNGRLLTAEDLEAEQQTRHAQRLQLTRALGDGVAYGLEVGERADSTLARPVVTVRPGLALARSGIPLELSEPVDLLLLRPQQTAAEAAAAAAGGGLFADCAPSPGGAYTAGRGVYLLVASPAETQRGRVASAVGSTARCGPLAVVEGISFRLVWLPFGAELLSPRLRNLVAHRLLGTDDARLTSFWSSPRGPAPNAYGLLDDLRPACLGVDDVPLATIGWRTTTTASVDAGALRGPGIQFVDMWPARRRLAPQEPLQRWPLLTGARRRAETQAALLQFADEVEDLVAAAGARTVTLASVTAASRFGFLPAVGILPLERPAARSTGFDPAAFFGAQALPGVSTLAASLLPSLVQESFSHEPVAVGGADRVQLYVLWENVTAGPRPGTARPPEPVLVFAKSTIPYRGTARFDWATWSHSRYVRVPI